MFHSNGDLRQRTFDLAIRIARLVCVLPKRDRIAVVWGDQLLRSGSSVGANYREAQRARSKAEQRSKLGECLREADETQYWIELIETQGLLPSKRLSDIKDETSQLIAIFVTLIRKS